MSGCNEKYGWENIFSNFRKELFPVLFSPTRKFVLAIGMIASANPLKLFMYIKRINPP
jgi:hypothetical protein